MKNVNIINEMSKLVQENVERWQGDFYTYDIVHLQMLVKRLEAGEIDNIAFYWITRKNGTHFIHFNDILNPQDYAIYLIDYYSYDPCARLYLVKLNEHKGFNWTGDIAQVDFEQVRDQIRENLKKRA